MIDASRWDVVRLKRVARIMGGGTPTQGTENWGGDVPFVTPPDLRGVHGRICAVTDRTLTREGASTGSAVAPAGSVVLSKRAPIGYVARLEMDAAFNQGCLALMPDTTQLDARFLTWSLMIRAVEMNALGRGTTFLEISSHEVGQLSLRLPPLDEQHAIIAYLDRETAKIDALIAEQQGLVDVLRERRSSIVESSLTTTDGRRSPFAWLGLIPVGWKVMALKHAVAIPITDGPHETPEFLDEGVPFLSAEGVSKGVVDLKRVRGYISPEDDARYAQKYRPRRGDIFMVKSGATTGTTAIVDTDAHFNIWSPLAAIRPAADIEPRYLYWFLSSPAFRRSVELHWSYGTQQNIGMGVLGSLPVVVPPIEEQRRIVASLDEQAEKIDALVAEAEGIVAVAKERRTALITAAVTGQIDVRGKVA